MLIIINAIISLLLYVLSRRNNGGYSTPPVYKVLCYSYLCLASAAQSSNKTPPRRYLCVQEKRIECAAIALRCNVHTYTLFLYLFIYRRKHKVSGRVRCRRPSLSIANSEKFLSKKFFR